jgi:hypothetical protein
MDVTQPGWACAYRRWECRRFVARGEEAQQNERKAKKKSRGKNQKITRKNQLFTTAVIFLLIPANFSVAARS